MPSNSPETPSQTPCMLAACPTDLHSQAALRAGLLIAAAGAGAVAVAAHIPASSREAHSAAEGYAGGGDLAWELLGLGREGSYCLAPRMPARHLPTLPLPALPLPVLPWPALSWPALPMPALPSPLLPMPVALPMPALPLPALPLLGALPMPVLPSPVLPCTLHGALPMPCPMPKPKRERLSDRAGGTSSRGAVGQQGCSRAANMSGRATPTCSCRHRAPACAAGKMHTSRCGVHGGGHAWQGSWGRSQVLLAELMVWLVEMMSFAMMMVMVVLMMMRPCYSFTSGRTTAVIPARNCSSRHVLQGRGALLRMQQYQSPGCSAATMGHEQWGINQPQQGH